MGCGVPFCLNGCPLGNLIPDWNGLVADGEWRRAIDQLHATNPFPELTGLICPAPCESACVLEINSEPVTIKQIELGIVERAWAEGWIGPQPPASRSGRRVAVVGSGPAGMAVAADLNQAGHTVVVFERDEAPGGLNRFGVPDAKLPKEVIDRRIAADGGGGDRVPLRRRRRRRGRSGGAAGRGRRAGAGDRGAGAAAPRGPRRRPARGGAAMTYLYARNRAVAAGAADATRSPSAAGKDVVVIGGGDTGADCMSNALREGASSVTQLDTYPAPGRHAAAGDRRLARGPAPPAHPLRTRRGRRAALGGRGDRRSPRRDGRAAAVEAIRVDPADRHAPLAGGEIALPAELVLVAIGFVGPEPELPARARRRPGTTDHDDRRAPDAGPRGLRRRRRPHGSPPHGHRDRRWPSLRRPGRSLAGDEGLRRISPIADRVDIRMEPIGRTLNAEEQAILTVLRQEGRSAHDRTASGVALAIERDPLDVAAALDQLGRDGLIAGDADGDAEPQWRVIHPDDQP